MHNEREEEHITVGKRVDLGVLAVDLDFANTSQGVGTSDVHGAGAANTLTAGTTEGKGGVDLVLDLDKGIEHHGTAVVHVNLVLLQLWLLGRRIGVLGKCMENGHDISTESDIGRERPRELALWS